MGFALTITRKQLHYNVKTTIGTKADLWGG
jgi:hypothetical protein